MSFVKSTAIEERLAELEKALGLGRQRLAQMETEREQLIYAIQATAGAIQELERLIAAPDMGEKVPDDLAQGEAPLPQGA